jgi:hypothetical protein
MSNGRWKLAYRSELELRKKLMDWQEKSAGVDLTNG